MFKVISIAAALIASSASAGEIVWRSPTNGLLTAISEPIPPTEPELPGFGIHYEPVSVSAGTSMIIKPIGYVSGYTFSLDQSLRPGLILDSNTGRVMGVAIVVGNQIITVRAEKDGIFSDLMLSITIS